MSIDDDVTFLRAVPYFRGLPDEDLAQIRTRCHTRHLEDGEILLLEGAPAEALYIVRSGRVRVFKTSADARKEQVLIVLGPGETFNDVPVFDGGPNPASVQATTPGTSLCVLPAARVAHLLATNPRVAANVIRVLAGRLRHLTLLVEDLSFHDITQRVARLLIEESARSGGPVTLSQQAMAMRVGTAREVVSRALRTLEQRGAITRRQHQIVEVRPQVLRALLGDSVGPDD
ncbi:MAG TPA: Crp/Fnr family transcriptional regulator [Chloroflexota bacterium]|nr:Crp/Fnr family transcriptional regulator [Chloroflexota bacterium]